MTYSIVPVHLAVKAMRDNGYKNAAYAIAELMDNSIQAGAKNVELLCAEKTNSKMERTRQQIFQIGVLDDACGMDKDTLRLALQFGNGTRLNRSAQTGIGRFGMGLPASSVSQCKRVEVWTWQDGIENALYTYLDLEDIVTKKLSEVPDPVNKPIPQVWLDVGKNVGRSGTLVVWSELDRVIWRTAKAIMDNSEFIIGRMYRKFLKSNDVKIRMVKFNYDRSSEISEDYVKANDPGYLMSDTSTPAPWNNEPMFQLHGDERSGVQIKKLAYNGEEHEVRITYSFAKPEARDTKGGVDAGSTPHGKHAGRNLGVSVVRAERELELDDSWTSPSDARERWWGIEVDFPPGLDEVFGVTNNKQHAHNFSELIKELDDDKSKEQLEEQFKDSDDPRSALIDLVWDIRRGRGALRTLVKAQRAGIRSASKKRYELGAEMRATEVTRERQQSGFEGVSDSGEKLPADERIDQIQHELEEQGMTETAANKTAAQIIDDGMKYYFNAADVPSPAFFTTRQKGGSIIITLNIEHPAYDKLLEVLQEDLTTIPTEDLLDRLKNSIDGLKLLLMAWARYEDEQPDGPRRAATQDTRADWGKVARQFIERG